MNKQLTDLVEYTISIEPEMDSVEGHFEFQEDIDLVNRKIREGNEWAWCVVRVCASINIDVTRLVGDSYLGCCSFDSEQDFINSGYYEDMKNDALDDLKREIKDRLELAEKLKTINQ